MIGKHKRREREQRLGEKEMWTERREGGIKVSGRGKRGMREVILTYSELSTRLHSE